MPPGADLDEAKAVEIIERGNTSTRQSEYVDLEYDPISLKEPQDLHSWDWLGCPSRFLRFLLHKSVQEVDGRDQHCALMFWMLILVGFIAYGAFLFAGPIQQRKNPPQSFEFLSDPEELGPISHLPYMIICPQLNWTAIRPDFGAITQLTVSSRGWVVDDPERVDYKGVHRAPFELFDVSPPDSQCKEMKGCRYFDGPRYSKSPNLSMPLDTRWISFIATVRLPEAKKNDWAVMNAAIYAGVEDPLTACGSPHVKPFMSVMPLSRRDAEAREFGMERVRLKYIANAKLRKKYHVLPRDSTYHVDFFEMNHVGFDTALKAWNETQEVDLPGYVTFAGGVSYRFAPMITAYTEIEPVNILAILCAIAGIWTAFVVCFKVLFPSAASGRRRVIKALRPWVSRFLPRRKSEAMQSLVCVLPPVPSEEEACYAKMPSNGNFTNGSVTNGSVTNGRHDSSALMTEHSLGAVAKETDEGVIGVEGGAEHKDADVRENFQTPSRRGFGRLRYFYSGAPGGQLANRSGSSADHTGPDERLVSLELPGPEERLHELEQTMKRMVDEMHRLRHIIYGSGEGEDPQAEAGATADGAPLLQKDDTQ